MLIANSDIPRPVIDALRTFNCPIVTSAEIGAVNLSGTDVLDHAFRHCSGLVVLVTRSKGVPMQAYANKYHERGLTVALLRWKHFTRRDKADMTRIIHRDAPLWEDMAKHSPSVISISRN